MLNRFDALFIPVGRVGLFEKCYWAFVALVGLVVPV